MVINGTCLWSLMDPLENFLFRLKRNLDFCILTIKLPTIEKRKNMPRKKHVTWSTKQLISNDFTSQSIMQRVNKI